MFLNSFISNNIQINYESSKDLSMALELPLVIHLYSNSPLISSFNEHIDDIYRSNNNGSAVIDLQFWQIIIHKFFLSVLDYGVRNQFLTYKVFNHNIMINAGQNIEKVVSLLNDVRTDIINIFGNGSRLLDRQNTIDVTNSIWRLLANKYGDTCYCNDETTEVDLANRLKKMVMGIRDEPKSRQRHTKGHLLYKLRTFALAVIVFIFLLSQMVLLPYVLGVATVVAFVQANMLITTGVVLGTSGLFALVSTSLFSSDMDIEMKQKELINSAVGLGCKSLSGYGQQSENNNQESADVVTNYNTTQIVDTQSLKENGVGNVISTAVSTPMTTIASMDIK
ncbi:hypothetical protein CAXC1_80008 [Candidatus Xenohaliotis californiensis]|uniref:Uncharacterized protein n=1 Tax=Candidatus Xenohaliotis californiensis TaxID=84677 RepID=A0ABP0EUA3_9RICK|nr:hypothetical protein CAXC1_80008 [Candidatus Xenohaliotis californiensis]